MNNIRSLYSFATERFSAWLEVNNPNSNRKNKSVLNTTWVLNKLPQVCLELVADWLEGHDLRVLKLTCKCMVKPVSNSQSRRIFSSLLESPMLSNYGLGNPPGKEIEGLYDCNAEETLKIIKQLKAEGRLSEINSAYYRNCTPLQTAASLGLIEKVKVLVEVGEAKDIFHKNKKKLMSALHTAAQHGHVDVVRYLLSQGARDEYTMYAENKVHGSLIPKLLFMYDHSNSCKEQLQCLGLLLSYAKDLKVIQNQLSASKLFAVGIACMNGRFDLMECLFNFGFQWDALKELKGRIYIFENAVVEGHLEIVRWLVNTYKMNVNYYLQDGTTPLHIAKAARKEDVVNYLLESGANPHALSGNGLDYRTFAKIQISKRAVEALAHYLESFAGFNEFESFEECYSFLRFPNGDSVIDNKGNTLLHLAAGRVQHEEVYEKIIPALIAKGGSIMTRNKAGKLPYDIGIDNLLLESCHYASEEAIKVFHNRVDKLRPKMDIGHEY